MLNRFWVIWRISLVTAGSITALVSLEAARAAGWRLRRCACSSSTYRSWVRSTCDRAVNEGSRSFHSVFILKGLFGAFNKEKVLVGTFSRQREFSRRLVDSSNLGPRLQVEEVVVEGEDEAEQGDLDLVLHLHPGGYVGHQRAVQSLHLGRAAPRRREEVSVLQQLPGARAGQVGGRVGGLLLQHRGPDDGGCEGAPGEAGV